MNRYYVYVYKDPRTYTPFYVGMGHGRRKYTHLTEARNKPEPTQGEHKLNAIRALLRKNLEPIIVTVDDRLTKEEAAEMEELLIAVIGRNDLGLGPLTNLTDGGDGTRGWSEEQRRAARERTERLGITPPDMTGKTYRRRSEECNIPCKIVVSNQQTSARADDPRWLTGEIVGINTGRVFNDDWLKKNAAGVSALKWWNNGVSSLRSRECPGPGWSRGRGKVRW